LYSVSASVRAIGLDETSSVPSLASSGTLARFAACLSIVNSSLLEAAAAARDDDETGVSSTIEAAVLRMGCVISWSAEIFGID